MNLYFPKPLSNYSDAPFQRKANFRELNVYTSHNHLIIFLLIIFIAAFYTLPDYLLDTVMKFLCFIALFSKQSSKLQKYSNKIRVIYQWGWILIKLWEDSFKDVKPRQSTQQRQKRQLLPAWQNSESIVVISSSKVKGGGEKAMQKQALFFLSRMHRDYCIL